MCVTHLAHDVIDVIDIAMYTYADAPPDFFKAISVLVVLVVDKHGRCLIAAVDTCVLVIPLIYDV